MKDSRLLSALTRAVMSLIAIFVIWGCQGPAPTRDQTDNSEVASTENGERYPHEIDLMSVVRRFLGPDGYMDPAFPPTVAEPRPYLTDFFGVLAIRDVPRSQIIADFVPEHATLTTESDRSVTLGFERGFTAVFYPFSSLIAAGAEAAVSHVVLSGDTWQEARANVESLIKLIERLDRGHAYLVDNPFYELEQKTFAVMQSGLRADVTVDPELSTFRDSDHGVLLFPEAVHGISKDADELIQIIAEGGFDWIGFESLNTPQQEDLDVFNRARAGTPEYAQARSKLVEYYAESWNGRAGPKTTGEENYYFKLAEAAHQAGARVIALEGSTIPYIFFRYGETSFGAAVRSQIWADATPPSGRGILFGGGAHFHYPDVPMVQDLILAESPNRPFFSTRDLWEKQKGQTR